MDSEKIASRLKNLRLSKNATTTEVAKACGITPQAVAMYEAGERIPRDEIKIRLAKYFKKSVGSIFFTD